MTTEQKQILKAHKAEAERRKTLARKELAELREERQAAIDLDDREYLKAVINRIHEVNMTILQNNKAIKEIDAKLAA